MDAKCLEVNLTVGGLFGWFRKMVITYYSIGTSPIAEKNHERKESETYLSYDHLYSLHKWNILFGDFCIFLQYLFTKSKNSSIKLQIYTYKKWNSSIYRPWILGKNLFLFFFNLYDNRFWTSTKKYHLFKKKIINIIHHFL